MQSTTTTSSIMQRVQTVPSFALVLLTIAYVVSPLDLVPDSICGAGQLDDFIVIVVAVVTLCQRWFGSSKTDDATAPVVEA